MDFREQIRNFIVSNFLFGDGSTLKDDTQFLENGVVDSTGLLEVIQFIEGAFAVTVEDHELLPVNLNSVNNIVRFLEAKNAAIRAKEPPYEPTMLPLGANGEPPEVKRVPLEPTTPSSDPAGVPL